MRQLTNEELEKEYSRFITNANSCGLGSFINSISEKFDLRSSVCGLSVDTGCAYPGSLISHINYVIAISQRMSGMISATFQTNQESIIKCCIIQHIAKSVMFEPNDNNWEVVNRGMVNKFSNLEGRLKCGARGILMANEYGVKFNAIEMEAITSLDRDDDSGKSFDNIMTIIIRQANELAYAIEKEKYGKI